MYWYMYCTCKRCHALLVGGSRCLIETWHLLALWLNLHKAGVYSRCLNKAGVYLKVVSIWGNTVHVRYTVGIIRTYQWTHKHAQSIQYYIRIHLRLIKNSRSMRRVKVLITHKLNTISSLHSLIDFFDQLCNFVDICGCKTWVAKLVSVLHT